MVREGFPPISKPLLVLLQGPEYEDHSLVSRPKETSTFEKTSSSYSWLYSFWMNIFPAKWAGNLLPISVFSRFVGDRSDIRILKLQLRTCQCAKAETASLKFKKARLR
jgi:hypothetical protein